MLSWQRLLMCGAPGGTCQSLGYRGERRERERERGGPIGLLASDHTTHHVTEAMSEVAELEQQPFSAELSAVVFGNAGTLRVILGWVGPGHFIYVASTCTSWRAAYLKALQGVLTRNRLCVGQPVIAAGTSYAAVLSSPSQLRLASQYGLKLTSRDNWALCALAGRHADLAMLQLAAELGLPMDHNVLQGAFSSDSVDSISKMAWLLDSKGVALIDDDVIAALIAKAPVQVLRWLHARGVVWPVAAMSIAARQGCVGTLEYLHGINFPWITYASEGAARYGHLPALKYLLHEG